MEYQAGNYARGNYLRGGWMDYLWDVSVCHLFWPRTVAVDRYWKFYYDYCMI